jgi:hypothetical protein
MDHSRQSEGRTAYRVGNQVIGECHRCLMKFPVSLDKVGTTLPCPYCDRPVTILTPASQSRRLGLAEVLIIGACCLFVLMGLLFLFPSPKATKAFNTVGSPMNVVTT